MKLISSLRSQYKNVFTSFKLYRQVYGGLTSLVCSPYLHAAIAISVLAYPLFKTGVTTPWYDIALSVLPNILGFTLGGYAILLAFGDEKFRELIAGKEEGEKQSPFMDMNGAFINFIFFQSVGILVAFLWKSWGWCSGPRACIGAIFFGNRPPRSPRHGEYLVILAADPYFLAARYRAGFPITS